MLIVRIALGVVKGLAVVIKVVGVLVDQVFPLPRAMRKLLVQITPGLFSLPYLPSVTSHDAVSRAQTRPDLVPHPTPPPEPTTHATMITFCKAVSVSPRTNPIVFLLIFIRPLLLLSHALIRDTPVRRAHTCPD